MDAAERSAPLATKLLKKYNSLLEEQILRNIIDKIQDKSRAICRITHGRGNINENIGMDINSAAKGLSPEDERRTHRCNTRISSKVREFCRQLSGDQKERVCSLAEGIEQATELSDQLEKTDLALEYVLDVARVSLQDQEQLP
jgi:hypothetical protein